VGEKIKVNKFHGETSNLQSPIPAPSPSKHQPHPLAETFHHRHRPNRLHRQKLKRMHLFPTLLQRQILVRMSLL